MFLGEFVIEMQQPSTPSPPAAQLPSTPQPASASSSSQPATPTPQQSAPPQSNQQPPTTPNGGSTPQHQNSSASGQQQHVTASPQQFCLRWNNYQSNLTNVFDQLLQSESFVDVTLACDGHSVKAHKMVLSACSPYFQSLFFDNPCQHPIVIMRDIKWPELKAAVEFMYKGEINVSQDQIGPLLKVAESLKIRGLADVNGEPDLSSAELTARPAKMSTSNLVDWDSPQSHHQRSSSTQNMDTLDNHHNHHNMHHHHHHRSKKRRRISGERSSLSSPAESACTDVLEGPNMPPSSSSVELTSPAPTTNQANAGGGSVTPQLPVQMQVGTANASAAAVAAQAALNAALQGGANVVGNDSGSSMSGMGGLSQMSHHQQQQQQQQPHPPPQISHVTDDLEIKPGIAEMIREEERAKLLESSHAWLGASTSSIAANSTSNPDYPILLKLKTPTWTQDQLKEAIDAVVKQKMRFTQAAGRFGIPKGTLYDNILGKSKRMAVLEEAGLTLNEENLVLEYCCEVSASPYNRRTKKSLADVINYVLKLRRKRDPEFMFSGLSGFRWWWAFCKKHSIVSLFYENKDGRTGKGGGKVYKGEYYEGF